jgi:hypothetical protein
VKRYKINRSLRVELEPQMHFNPDADLVNCLAVAEASYHVGDLEGTILKSFQEDEPYYEVDKYPYGSPAAPLAFPIAMFSVSSDDNILDYEEVLY